MSDKKLNNEELESVSGGWGNPNYNTQLKVGFWYKATQSGRYNNMVGYMKKCDFSVSNWANGFTMDMYKVEGNTLKFSETKEFSYVDLEYYFFVETTVDTTAIQF